MQDNNNKNSALLLNTMNPIIAVEVIWWSYKVSTSWWISWVAHRILWGRFQPEFPEVREELSTRLPIEILEGQFFAEWNGIYWLLCREKCLFQDKITLLEKRDRFIFNWQKLRSEDSYPRYEKRNQIFREKIFNFENLFKMAEWIKAVAIWN